MKDLRLRLRVFLFFCLIGGGGVAVVIAALFMGYRQLGAPEALSSFITAGIVASFGTLALSTFVWRLFDENISKPIEVMAAQFRVRAESGINTTIDESTGRYLGDLAPAACAINEKLGQASRATAETVAEKTARLERQRAQLLRILSDIPVAVIVATWVWLLITALRSHLASFPSGGLVSKVNFFGWPRLLLLQSLQAVRQR